MSTPRTKRQFAGAASDPSQRQITSFFASASASPQLSIQEPLQQPVLPANVQTNLLSVGMRVRKSVPEGYKTGTPYSGFKLWSDADSMPSRPMLRKHQTPTPAQRELLPFCGIHSIGGMSHQPTRDEDEDSNYYNRNLFLDADVDVDDVPALDDVPGLTSSQETVDSAPPSVSGSQAGKKRFFDDAGEDEPRQWTDSSAWSEGGVSPRSLAPVGWGNARPIAVPRNLARRKAAAAGVMLASSFEQENVAMQDFEEADFLVGEGMDLTGA